MRFSPPHCPNQLCRSQTAGDAFLWHRKGTYPRKCDGRRVQRFLCKTCGKRFSTQAFRLDYRLGLPRLHLQLFDLFVSKVTMRQASRILNVSRHTVAQRLNLLGQHSREYHKWRMKQLSPPGGWVFQLDEMETYETDRRLSPVTVPVLIERKSLFLVDLDAAPMGPRGRLTESKNNKKTARELLLGKRKSGSRKAVKKCFQTLSDILPQGELLLLQTDQKTTYRKIVADMFQGRIAQHVRESSRTKRNRKNVLFPINHTLAMMRDGVSRLVRRNWGVSKRRTPLKKHLWIWAVYRNYIRAITVCDKVNTPAMVFGATNRKLKREELLRWRSSSLWTF
jgi:transposase-like protein